VGVMGGGAGEVARVIGACGCQHLVWQCLLCTGRVVGSCTAHWTLTSQAWTESVPDPRGAWKVEKGGRTRSAAVTAYAVGAGAVSRAASLTASAWLGAWSDECSAMVLGADGWGVLAGGGCVLGLPAHRWQRVGRCSRVSAGYRQASRARADGFAGGEVLCEQRSRVDGRIFRLGCGISGCTPRTSPPVFLFARAALAARRISTARYNPRCRGRPHPDPQRPTPRTRWEICAIVSCMTTVQPDERTSANSRTPLPQPHRIATCMRPISAHHRSCQR
jgi:hypothetical protein